MVFSDKFVIWDITLEIRNNIRRVPKAANIFDEAKTHYFEQFATVKTGFILNMRLTVTSE